MRLAKALLTNLDTDNAQTDSPVWGQLSAWITTLNQQNFSQHTIDAYHSSLVRFINHIEQNSKHGDITQCDRQDLLAYFAHRLDTDHIKSLSAKQELSAIRKFYQYLIDKGQMTHNPASNHKLKREPRKLPTIATEELICQLLEQPMPEDPAKARLWVRDKAIFELIYSSGLRISELAGLDLSDIDFGNRIVRVLGKGNKMRQVPIGSKAIIALQNYLPHRTLWQEQESNALFISERHGTRLSVRAIQLRLNICATNAGIEQHLHPHLLRHCFASHLLSASGDLRAVQEMLGHQNLSTTQIYTQVDFNNLAKIYDNAHPRAIKHSR